MRKIILGLLIVAAAVSSCAKKSDSVAPEYNPCALQGMPDEIARIGKFLSDSGIVTTATKQCGTSMYYGGMYYEIKNPGTGATPNMYSYLTVKYRGAYVKPGATSSIFFDGTKPDSVPVASQVPVDFQVPLLGLIDGWKKGLPLIKVGGSIVLYIPPSQGYGSTANGPIPANSILVFKIDLVGVK